MTNDGKISLYFAPGSSSLAPHIALHEAGAPFDAVPVMLANGEQRQPEYLKINRLGRIPAIMVGDQAITEVIGTLAWIAHRYPEAGLLPLADPLAVGRAFSVMSWYATTLAVGVAQMLRTERFTPDEALWPQLKDDAQVRLEAGYAAIEDGFDGPWILGNRFSVVDCYALVLWRWGQRFGFPPASFPAWSDHAARMMERPAVIAALATEQAAAAAGSQSAPAIARSGSR